MAPGGELINPLLRNALWQQFGATLEMFEAALLACPDALWQGQLWSDDENPEYPVFWSIAYHVLFWLDLYLTGSQEGFAPPAPFVNKLDPACVPPTQPYSKDELHAYLLLLRKKCQATIADLSGERASQQVAFPWMEEISMNFLELLLYNMRHVQEHAAQLNLFLGLNGLKDVPDWVPQAQAEENGV